MKFQNGICMLHYNGNREVRVGGKVERELNMNDGGREGGRERVREGGKERNIE